MAAWVPLAEPHLGAQQFAEWRPLLESDRARNSVLTGAAEDGWGFGGVSSEEDEDPYAALVNLVVVPKLRSAITGWEPRQPEVLMGWLDVWEKMLPRGVLNSLLTTQVGEGRREVGVVESLKECVCVGGGGAVTKGSGRVRGVLLSSPAHKKRKTKTSQGKRRSCCLGGCSIACSPHRWVNGEGEWGA